MCTFQHKKGRKYLGYAGDQILDLPWLSLGSSDLKNIETFNISFPEKYTYIFIQKKKNPSTNVCKPYPTTAGRKGTRRFAPSDKLTSN